MATSAQIEQAILNRFATMWDAQVAPGAYAIENEGAEFAEDQSWARILFRYARPDPTQQSVGQVIRRQRQGVFLVQIRAPKDAGTVRIGDLEDAVVAEFEDINKRTLNVKFGAVFPTRLGVRDGWMRSDVSIIFTWDHHG